MLGVYDYTVILTYMSAISAGIGIMASQHGVGDPYIGCVFLVICGICDAFDGAVARTKKNRTEYEQRYGIQIDSLSDLIAFGVLPACIFNSCLNNSEKIVTLSDSLMIIKTDFSLIDICYVAMFAYVLAALIRLAHYNVSEDERRTTEGGKRKYYEGLPVTASAVMFPLILIIQKLSGYDCTVVYAVVMFLTACAFVSKLKIPKPQIKSIVRAIGLAALCGLIIIVRKGLWF